MIEQPIFAIGDLHMGDCGPRDNFHYMGGLGIRKKQFMKFLDHVEKHEGRIVACGDLLELWQANTSKVLVKRKDILDRLAAIGTTVLIGNHDIDLAYFTETYGIRLDHPLFRNIVSEHTEFVNGKQILFIHGHMQDRYCCQEEPGLSRISMIYTGLREDLNGGPLSRFKYGGRTVEARSLARWARFQAFCKRMFGHPNATMENRIEILKTFKAARVDALVFGHTHEPGQFIGRCDVCGRGDACKTELPIYNVGTWAESVNSFVRIDVEGGIRVFDWTDKGAVHNTTTLEVK